jgi:hypothetical protein
MTKDELIKARDYALRELSAYKQILDIYKKSGENAIFLVLEKIAIYSAFTTAITAAEQCQQDTVAPTHIGIDLADKPDFSIEHVVIPRDDLEDAYGIIYNLISNIKSKGNYTPETTVTFLEQCIGCIKPYVKGGCDD